ncbi:hypothetical protein [Cellulomonas sp. URHE0023]|uniref:hypothetical protein n=1 Tax=Cellulomonas sp. URHE0023 TaxID=1380354 RepID=UPI000486FEC1|nr:hypothetical protein [Cellulomonas sp. URHE0023]
MTTWLPSLAGAVGAAVGGLGGLVLTAAAGLDGVAALAVIGVLALVVGCAAGGIVKHRVAP